MVMKCLEKDPAERPSSAAELIAALDQVHVSGAQHHGAMNGGRSSRLRWIAAIVAVLLLAAAIAPWRMPARGAPLASASAVKSIAILPFESVGGDTANTYFAEGIADALTTALTQLPGIRVAGRSSAARFRGRAASAREVGSALDVGSVLEGTVRRAGDRVRVTAQLTGASDGLIVWTESYDREAKDVFALQDDITRAIVVALRGKLAGTTASSTPAIGTANLEAYDLYLRGMYLYRRRGASLKRGADLLEEAIGKDSTFARAHAALASALLLEPYYSPTRVKDVLPRARAAAERAVALEPTLSDAHLALATAHLHAFEWEAALAEARRAVELEPTSSDAHYRLGFILLTSGRAEDAMPEFAAAKAIDPLYAIAGAYLGHANGLAHHMDVAIAEGVRAVDLDSTLASSMTLLARTYGQAGRSADALAVTRRVLATASDPRILGLAANTLARNAQLDESRGIMKRLEALPETYPQRNTGLTYAFLGMGDTARALAAMERAVDSDGVLLLSAVPEDYTYDPVRSSARFAAILRRLGLDPTPFTGRGRQK
jgi:serine/threonine-protein kinase